MNINKTNILSAVAELIEGYKKNNLTHSTGSCALCHVYCIDDEDCRSICLNTVFAPRPKDFSCVDRIKKYYYLNWNNSDNKLVEYWTDIFKMLEGETEIDIIDYTKAIQAKILEIANKYQDQ